MFGRLFASFFGALAVAGAFAYYNYKFSQFKFIDFTEFIGYTNKDLFEPLSDKYLVIIYNSRDIEIKERLKNLKVSTTDQILAIDYFQNTSSNLEIGEGNVSTVKFGTDTFLKLVNRFNIDELPMIFYIEKINNKKYKQSSKIYILENFRNK